MTVEDADAFVPFQDVRIVNATASGLLCGIGDRRVWLPRFHVSGKLWSAGDRGKLFIRRWVARDRGLLPEPSEVSAGADAGIWRKPMTDLLHAVRRAPLLVGRGVGKASRQMRASAPRGQLSSTSGPEQEPVSAIDDGPLRSLATSLVERRRLRAELAARPDDTPKSLA